MRVFSSLLVLAALGYGAGLLLFANSVQKPPPPMQPADGIVALTGGELRVDRAAALLERKLGKRLLITGVDLSATKADIKRLAHGRTRFDCCADLGFVAADTHGNAGETAEWAQEHGYKSLIIVTANYHMPRALTEFSAAMPGVDLRPYPVQPENLDLTHWWRRPQTLRLLNSEYAKFLASWTMNVVVWPLLEKADVEKRPA